MELQRKLLPVISYRVRYNQNDRRPVDEWQRALSASTHTPQCGYSNTFAVLVRVTDNLAVAGKVCVKEFPDFCGGAIVHSGRVSTINTRRGYCRWASYIASGTTEQLLDVPHARDIYEWDDGEADSDVIEALRERVAESLVAAVLTWAVQCRRTFLVLADKQDGNLTTIADILLDGSHVGSLRSYEGGGWVNGQMFVPGPTGWRYGDTLEINAPLIPNLSHVTGEDEYHRNNNSGNQCRMVTAYFEFDGEDPADEEEWEMDHENWYPDECPNCGGTNFEAEGGWEWSCLDDGCEHSWYEEAPGRPTVKQPTTHDRMYLDALRTKGYFEWLPTGEVWNG